MWSQFYSSFAGPMGWRAGPMSPNLHLTNTGVTLPLTTGAILSSANGTGSMAHATTIKHQNTFAEYIYLLF
jgi:hypothetical protein